MLRDINLAKATSSARNFSRAASKRSLDLEVQEEGQEEEQDEVHDAPVKATTEGAVKNRRVKSLRKSASTPAAAFGSSGSGGMATLPPAEEEDWSMEAMGPNSNFEPTVL